MAGVRRRRERLLLIYPSCGVAETVVAPLAASVLLQARRRAEFQNIGLFGSFKKIYPASIYTVRRSLHVN
ncbi:unnamed protein product [Rhodiola kirilowii]